MVFLDKELKPMLDRNKFAHFYYGNRYILILSDENYLTMNKYNHQL